MKKIITLCVIIGTILMVCGCVEEKPKQEEPTPSETTSTSFYIGDEYADDFKYVNVTFSEIKLHQKIEDDDESWVYLLMEEKTIDLKSLHDQNVTALLNTVEIEVGNYSKLWINVSNATGVLNETNEIVNFTVPSGWLKIQQLHLFNITKGNNSITVYIDLDKSIKSFHNGTDWKLTPVISSISHKIENQFKFKENDQSNIRNMANSAPTIDIVVNGSTIGKSKKVYVDADEYITFNASGSYDVDEDDITFLWDFGDGTTSNEPEIDHNFTYSNIPYKVTLTVSDDKDESEIWFNVHINKTTGNSGDNGE